MARTDIYASRKLKFVAIAASNATIKYGFLTPVSDVVSQALGHQPIENNTTNLVLGVNNPKPAKASKDGISSFVATASINNARQAGWKISKKLSRIPAFYASPPTTLPQRGSIAVYVELGAIFYAWRMPAYQYNFFTTAQRTALKIKVPANESQSTKMLFGASFPKPGRASKVVSTTSGVVQKVTTFYGDGADLSQFRNITQPYISLG